LTGSSARDSFLEEPGRGIAADAGFDGARKRKGKHCSGAAGGHGVAEAVVQGKRKEKEKSKLDGEGSGRGCVATWASLSA
jgi:hypothetical protein